MTEADKVRENRARRAAHRQGLRLTKSRRRDPRASDYGTYGLVDIETRGLVLGHGHGHGYSLDDVEAYLNGAR